jgi:hypothetical protein
VTKQEASDGRRGKRGKDAGLDKKDEAMHLMLGMRKEK